MPLRERILAVGPQGSGKTYAWLTIARALPGVTFHVIDPDDGTERVWVPEFPDVKNIKYYFTPTWNGSLKEYEKNKWQGGIMSAFKQIVQTIKPMDWIIDEHLGMQWDMTQSEFTAEVFQKGIGEYFLEARKRATGKRLEAFEGWKDWPVIKKMFNEDYFWKLCYQLPVHLFCTSTYTMYDRPPDLQDSELEAFYSGTKIRIDGEKRIPLKVHTILLLQGPSPQQTWKVTTFLKDRGRRFLRGVELHDFYTQYLVAVANWKLE